MLSFAVFVVADAESTPPPPPTDVRPSGRRWKRWSLRFALVFVGLVIAAYLLREQVVHPLLVRALPRIARSAAGIEVSLEELHGDWWTRLEGIGLQIGPGATDGGLRALDARRVVVEYSLLDWVRGVPAWLHGAEAHGVRAEIDLSEPGEPAPEGSPPADPRAIVERLPGLSASDIEVELALPGERTARARVERLELGTVGAEGRAWSLDAALLAGTLHASGTLSATEIAGEITLGQVSVPDALQLAGAQLQSGGFASLSAELHLPWADPLSGSASLELETSGLELQERSVEVGRASVRLVDGALSAPLVEIRSGGNELVARDASLPLAAFRSEAPYERLSAELELDLRDLAQLLAPGREAPEHRLVLRGRIEPGHASIQRGAFEIPGGSIDLKRGEVSFVDAGDGRRRVHLDLDVDLGDLTPLEDIVGLGAWRGSLVGSLALDADAEAFEGSAHLVGEDVVAAGVPLGALVLDAGGRRDTLTVAQLSSEGELGTLRLRGSYRFEDAALEDVVLEATLEHLEQVAASLAGRASIDLRASGPWRTPDAHLELEARDLVLAGEPVGALNVVAQSAGGRFEVERLDAWSDELSASARLGGVLPWTDPAASGIDLHVDTLCLARGAIALELQEPTRLRASSEAVVLDETRLGGTAGDVRASFERHGTDLRARLLADLADTGPLLAPLLGPRHVGGSLEARLELDAHEGTYVAHTSGSARSLLLPWLEGPTRLDWQAVLTPAGLEVSELSASGAGRAFLDVSAELPIDPSASPVLVDGPLALHARLTDPPWSLPPLPLGETGARAAGRLTAELELGGTWHRPSGSARFDVDGLTLVAGEGDRARELLPAPASARGSLAFDEALELEGVRVEVPGAAQVEVSGTVGLPLDLVRWLEGDVDAGTSPLDLTAEVSWSQLEWLVRELEGLRRLSGRGEGRVAVGGTLDAPRVSGELHVREGNLRLEADVPPLAELEADLRLEDSEVHLERLHALLGAAPLEATGKVDLRSDPALVDLHVQGDNVLLQRSTNVLLRADADLTLKGPLDGLLISGNLGLRNGRLTQTVDLLGFLEGGRKPSTSGLQLFSIRSGPLAAARFDVAVETRDPFLVRTNMARASMRISLRITGTGEVPTPAGDLFLDDATVKLPSGLVRFPSGLIRFDSANPFTPQLDLKGEARLLGYDITIQVSESYDAPEIVLSSSPPLANDEILALVLTGQPPRGSSGRAGATSTVALYLMQDLFARWTAGGVDSFDDSLLARFDMASGRDVSEAGLATIEATYRLADGVVTPNDQLFLVGDRDVYEFYNFGIRLVFRLR